MAGSLAEAGAQTLGRQSGSGRPAGGGASNAVGKAAGQPASAVGAAGAARVSRDVAATTAPPVTQERRWAVVLPPWLLAVAGASAGTEERGRVGGVGHLPALALALAASAHFEAAAAVSRRRQR